MKQLSMKYAGGGIVRHLGLQNYRGPVPALAELIANAWDADAGKVEVTIPLGRSLHPRDEIIVKDDGCGMSFGDCDDKYLVIGLNRREVERTDRTPGGRRLMAHKGLGKLAGFGIAKVVEVKTISEGKLTQFRMSFDDIDKLKQGETYLPTMIADEEPVDVPNGTEVMLKELSLQRAIPEDEFFRSMASRFSVFSDKFKVYINETLLKKSRVPLEFRFPEKDDPDITEIDEEGFGTSVLSNGEEIKWWIGFTPDTIKWKEIHGVSVISRGRVAQDPWDFNLAGGTWGQHGVRYLTGEIIAEFVDEGIPYEGDTIITNRSALKWTDPQNDPLYQWGRKKIRMLLREWSERRGKKTFEKVKKKYPELVEKIERFQPREKKELNLALRSLAQVPTIDEKRLIGIFEYVIDGYVDKSFIDMLDEIKDLPPEEMVRTLEILREFDVSEAIRVHKIVSSHVRVIRTFGEMIKAGVPEKPDMHEHIRKYPWLLGIKYQTLDYERSLQKILQDHFGIKPDDEEGRKRPDFVVMRSGTDVVVIELKRPGETVGLNELRQTAGYVDYLRDWVEMGNPEELTGSKISREDIIGFLIAYDIRDDSSVRGEIRRLERDRINVVKWFDLLRKAEDDHKKFLEIVKSRAPENDPRIKELERREII